jgi:D-3-phosphoglycerate dehydrogenase
MVVNLIRWLCEVNKSGMGVSMAVKKVLITDYVWPSVEPEEKVLEKYGIELLVAPNGDEDTLVKMAKEVDGILTCFAKVTGNVVKSAKNCKVIGRFGVGVDNIDVEEATNQGILVTYVPDYCVDEVSEHVIGLLLAWNRRIVLHNNDTKLVGWGNAGLGMRIMRLRGKKIGIIGFGRIGRMVAQKSLIQMLALFVLPSCQFSQIL